MPTVITQASPAGFRSLGLPRPVRPALADAPCALADRAERSE
jgi:hypothetical protein